MITQKKRKRKISVKCLILVKLCIQLRKMLQIKKKKKNLKFLVA